MRSVITVLTWIAMLVVAGCEMRPPERPRPPDGSAPPSFAVDRSEYPTVSAASLNFTLPRPIDAPSYIADARDLNDDQVPDVLTNDELFLSSASGGWKGVALPPDPMRFDCQFADANPDGSFGVICSGLRLFRLRLSGELTEQVLDPVVTNGGWTQLADVNEDGRVDIVSMYWAAGPATGMNPPVAVFFGQADGSFTTHQDLLGSGMLRALGDFNGDQHVDALALNGSGSDGEDVVLLGHGDGTFATPVPVPHVEAVWYLVEDFDGDGLDDLASYRPGAWAEVGLWVQRGRTGGVLSEAEQLTADPSSALDWPRRLDWDGDGRPDIIGVSAGHLAIFSWKANQAWQPQVIHTGLETPRAILDFDRDGYLDVLGAASSQSAVAYGDGVGSVPGPTSTGLSCQAFTLGDLNGDQRLDIVCVDIDGKASVALQGADFRFTPATLDTGGSDRIGRVFVADVDHDGKQDLLWNAVYPVDAFYVAIGLGDGTFMPPTPHLTDGRIGAIGDLNRDGHLDLVALHTKDEFANQCHSSTRTHTGASLLGDGGGGFAPSSAFAIDQISGMTVKCSMIGPDQAGVALADLNGDTHLDLLSWDAATTGSSGSGGFNVWTHPGLGDGSFGAQTLVASPAATRPSVLLGDFDLDGRMDFVAGGLGGSSIATGRGDGTFSLGAVDAPVRPLAVGQLAGSFSPFALYLDEKSRLLVADAKAIHLQPQGPRWLSAGDIHQVAIADLDADGNAELVLSHSYFGQLDIVRAYRR